MTAAPQINACGADLLRRFFALLDEHAIRYCVLHSYEALPEVLPTDLDTAIHPSDVGRLPDVFRSLADCGYIPAQQIGYSVRADYFVFGWTEGGEVKTFPIDVITEHRRGGVRLASGKELVAGRRRYEAFWIPAPASEFRYLLMKKVFKGSISRSQQSRLKALRGELGADEADRIVKELFGPTWAPKVVEALREESFHELLAPLARHVRLHRLVRSPFQTVSYWFGDALRGVKRCWQPTGFFVSVLGPDGVGKSTLLDGLEGQRHLFRRCARFHWRPMLVGGPGRRRGMVSPRSAPPHGLWRSLLGLGLQIADYWLGYLLLLLPALVRSSLIIFDRYYYDMPADPERYRYGGPRKLLELLCRAVPRPDLTLLLDAPADVIVARKDELTLPEAAHLRASYLAIREGVANLHLLDAAQPAEAVLAQANRIIFDEMARRFHQRSPIVGFGRPASALR